MKREQLKDEFQRLSDDANFPTAADKRRRGRDFERLIYNLLDNEGLQQNTAFRPNGEEIDGSFILGHSVFLIEAKWHISEMPASSIYQFKGKVDGKLVGTIGVYLSMSGFSGEAVDALTFGKSINILLFDNEDFKTCINEENGFTKVLLEKLRVATEKGTVFFQIKSVTVSSQTFEGKPKVTVSQIDTSSFLTKTDRQKTEQLVFIVEGVSDQQIITALAEKIYLSTNERKQINIVVAGGKYSVAKLANTIKGDLPENSKPVLIVDADANREETLNLLMQILEDKEITTIIPDPEIEVWLSRLNIRSRKELRNMTVHNKVAAAKYMSDLIDNLDIEELKETDNSFRKFYEALTE